MHCCHCIVISNTNTQHNAHRTTERSQRHDDDPIFPRWSSSEENWSSRVLIQLHIVHFDCIHSTQFTSLFPFHNHNLSLGKLKNQFCFYRFPFLDYRRISTIAVSCYMLFLEATCSILYHTSPAAIFASGWSHQNSRDNHQNRVTSKHFTVVCRPLKYWYINITLDAWSDHVPTW